MRLEDVEVAIGLIEGENEGLEDRRVLLNLGGKFFVILNSGHVLLQRTKYQIDYLLHVAIGLLFLNGDQLVFMGQVVYLKRV